MTEPNPLTLAQLEAGLETIRQSPKNEGVLHLIVRRPQIDQRKPWKLENWMRSMGSSGIPGERAAAIAPRTGRRTLTCN
jgi:hypothetical protein